MIDDSEAASGRIRGDLKERTLDFGIRALAVVRRLPNETSGWTVGKQLARSATSIGANVWEADAALTDAEFAHKISLARKEANETQFWLQVATRAELLSTQAALELIKEVDELVRILSTIVLKTQNYMRKP